MTFKVGDIVTGIPGSKKTYGITNENGKFEVIEIRDNNYIELKVLSHEQKECIFGIFSVKENYFKLVTPDWKSIIK